MKYYFKNIHLDEFKSNDLYVEFTENKYGYLLTELIGRAGYGYFLDSVEFKGKKSWSLLDDIEKSKTMTPEQFSDYEEWAYRPENAVEWMVYPDKTHILDYIEKEFEEKEAYTEFWIDNQDLIKIFKHYLYIYNQGSRNEGYDVDETLIFDTDEENDIYKMSAIDLENLKKIDKYPKSKQKLKRLIKKIFKY